MERLRKTFQVSAALAIAAAAVIFAAAEGSPLPALTLPLMMFALLVIDIPGRRGVPGAAGVLLSGVALAAAVTEFLLAGIEARLLAPAHFLTYLTWIVILQSKMVRQYWLLFGLSVLQIAVAALLTTDAWLGIALTVYSFLALWTLTSFTVYRAALRVHYAGRISSTEGEQRQSDMTDHRHERSSVRSVGQLQSDSRIIGPRFAVGTVGTSALSLMLAGLFFLYTPRVWLGQIRLFDNSALAAGLRPLTGFSEQVTLGDMGEILTNDELVLEYELFDEDTGAAVPPEQYFEKLGSEDPLFRGMTHEIYSDGRWAQISGLRYRTAPDRSRESGLLRQVIRLHPNGSSILFVAGDAHACFTEDTRNNGVEMNRATRIFRSKRDDADATETRYVVLSTPGSVSVPSGVTDYRDYWRSCRELPPSTGRIVDLADETVNSHSGSASASDIAGLLTAYLRDSGEFSYSMSLAIDDPTVDPLEDFVFNRRSGHCEYFASALAIMLRAEGIHSRLVGGFKGGSFNPATGKFEVRQLHAHSWVEAYLDGVWKPLDPTPPARDLTVANLEIDSATTFSRWKRAWESIWSKGVQLSKGDQDRMLYEPVRETAIGAWSALQDVRGSSVRLGTFIRSLFESPERWFSWRGGVTVFVLLGMIVVVTRCVRRVAGIVKRRTATSQRDLLTRQLVPFFERYVRIVARSGLKRRIVQTQLEFADQAEQQLFADLPVPEVSGLPRDITEKFYQIRFGRRPITVEESTALDKRLDGLEQALEDVSLRES